MQNIFYNPYAGKLYVYENGQVREGTPEEIQQFNNLNVDQKKSMTGGYTPDTIMQMFTSTSPVAYTNQEGQTFYTLPQGVDFSQVQPGSQVNIDGKTYNYTGGALKITNPNPGAVNLTPATSAPAISSTYYTNPSQNTALANATGANAAGINYQTSGATLPADSSSNVSQTNQLTDQQFSDWLNQQDLTSDQKAAISALYNAVGTNDQATADKIKAAIQAGTAYSSPYFKSQANLVIDALTRGLSAQEGDLSYQESSLNNRLEDLRKTLANSGDYLTFQEQQQLKELERNYGTQLQDLQQNLAANGLTSSSIRTNKESILNNTYGDMRESAQRSLQYQLTNQANQLSSSERDTAAEIARLTQVAAQNKTNLLRGAEQQVGSNALSDLGYTDVLGGVGGSIPRAQAQDALSFASNFVF